jgi:hypothetical protein
MIAEFNQVRAPLGCVGVSPFAEWTFTGVQLVWAVVGSIVQPDSSPQERAAVVQHWIRVAQARAHSHFPASFHPRTTTLTCSSNI